MTEERFGVAVEGLWRERETRREARTAGLGLKAGVTFRNAFSWSSVKVMRGASCSASLSTLMGAKGDGTRLTLKTPLSSSSSSKSMRIAHRRAYTARARRRLLVAQDAP